MKLNQNDDICPEINKVYCMDNLKLMKQVEISERRISEARNKSKQIKLW